MIKEQQAKHKAWQELHLEHDHCECIGVQQNKTVFKHTVIDGYYKRCVECGRIHWVKKPDGNNGKQL